MKADIQILADHVGIPAFQYLREILISRLLGHGMLPSRPEMLEAVPLPAAEAWCKGEEVPMREISEQAFRARVGFECEVRYE